MKGRLKETLYGILSDDELAYVHNSYDIVGDIAIVRLTQGSEKHRQTIGEAIMTTYKNVKTVLAQTSPVHGDFRLRKLEYVAGENRTTAIHRESQDARSQWIWANAIFRQGFLMNECESLNRFVKGK